jgi:hypothetical protein
VGVFTVLALALGLLWKSGPDVLCGLGFPASTSSSSAAENGMSYPADDLPYFLGRFRDTALLVTGYLGGGCSSGSCAVMFGVGALVFGLLLLTRLWQQVGGHHGRGATYRPHVCMYARVVSERRS